MLSLVPLSVSAETADVNWVTRGWKQVNRTVFNRYKVQEKVIDLRTWCVDTPVCA